MDIVKIWSQFKSLVSARSLQMQWIEDDLKYVIFAEEGMIFWFCEISKTGSSDLTDFETNYKNSINKKLETIFITKKGNVGDRSWLFSHNFCDKTTWFGDAVKITNESVGTGNGTTTVFNLAHTDIIDVTHGKISDEIILVPTASQGGSTYAPVVKVDETTKAERAFAATSGGDYTINYSSGVITFFTAPANGLAITADYFYSPVNSGSTMYFRPTSGKLLVLSLAEMLYTADVGMIDNIVSAIYTYNPSLGAPPAKFEYPGTKSVFKTMYDFINYTSGSFPIIPQTTNQNARAITQDVIQLRFDYISTVEVPASAGAELRVWLENHVPFTGSRSSFTFYGYQRPE